MKKSPKPKEQELPPIPFARRAFRQQGKVIGIGGQKENGKSTLCNLLLAMLDDYSDHNQLNPEIRGGVGGWRRAKLSHPIKQVAAALIGCSTEYIEANKDGPPPPGWNKNIRWVLELLGNGLTEACDDLWISRAVLGASTNVISDDIRRIVELKTIKSIGGTTILVWRPGYENTSKAKTESGLWPIIKNHIDAFESTSVDGAMCIHPLVDYFIVNKGTEKQLKKKLQKVVIEGIFGPLLERDYSNYAAK